LSEVDELALIWTYSRTVPAETKIPYFLIRNVNKQEMNLELNVATGLYIFHLPAHSLYLLVSPLLLGSIWSTLKVQRHMV
jgi:hypothetical protein